MMFASVVDHQVVVAVAVFLAGLFDWLLVVNELNDAPMWLAMTVATKL